MAAGRGSGRSSVCAHRGPGCSRQRTAGFFSTPSSSDLCPMTHALTIGYDGDWAKISHRTYEIKERDKSSCRCSAVVAASVSGGARGPPRVEIRGSTAPLVFSTAPCWEDSPPELTVLKVRLNEAVAERHTHSTTSL
jgi:hypothetical protein